MIGTTAALIGMAAATAGSKVAGAVISNKGANNAAKIQQQAAADVGRKNDSLWTDYQNQAAPYLKSGQQSMNLLSSLMLPPGSPGSYQPQPPPAPTPSYAAPRGPIGGRGSTTDLRGGGSNPAFSPWSVAGGQMPMPQRPMSQMPMPQGPPPSPNPFGYTNNSLMVPWTRPFIPPQGT